MIRRLALSTTVVGVAAILAGSASLDEPRPELSRLKTHVETLASPDFAGRGEGGAIKARAYVLDEFKRLGLTPLFGDSYTQDVTGKGPGNLIGVNVGAKLEGSDAKVADRWLILGTHYDHLGTRGDVYFPGADDNASGVAMMLEVARSVVGSSRKPRRSIGFVGFDLEERGPNGELGLRGSRHFAAHPPIGLDKVNLFVTADMIGRSLAGVCKADYFVLGSEHEPEVRPWISRAAEGLPFRMGLLGSDLLVIDRSDYGPFRMRKIPYLFFTTGESPVYHTPRDVAETIEYPKLEAISRVIHGVIREGLDSEIDPTWAPEPNNPVAEALTIRRVFQTLLDHRDRFPIADYQLKMMDRTIKTIDEVERRGSMTSDERNAIAGAAKIILFTVL